MIKRRSVMHHGQRMCVVLIIAGSLLGSQFSAGQSVYVEDLGQMSLQELMSVQIDEIRAGEPGSYARRLSEYVGDTNIIQIHGYFTTELIVPHNQDSKETTFDQHHAVLMFRGHMNNDIVPEIGLEYEHAGGEFYLPFAFVDIQPQPNLVARIGYFVVPVGAFNEYQYPDFLRRTAQAPILSREVVPSLWSEVGIQLRGKLPLENDCNINYAVFLVNGLEQKDADQTDDLVDEGGGIRAMRRNYRDKTDGDKALGGRLGFQLAQGINVGVSGYTGAYTADGRRRLTIADIDFTYQRDRWLFRAEAATAIQEVTDEDLHKSAAYVLGAFRSTNILEPYLQLEVSDLDEGPTSRKVAALCGMAFHLYPETSRNALVKAEWRVVRDGEDETTGDGVIQLTLSF